MNILRFSDTIWIIILYIMTICRSAPNVPVFQILNGNFEANVSYVVEIDDATDRESLPPSYANVETRDPKTNQYGMPDEQKLMNYLFKTQGYERTVRPVRNASTAVIIRMGLTLTQIFDMDEKDQVLVTNVWLDQEWKDEFMRWEPKEFSNITVLRIPCHKLWLPDMVLYNNAAEYTDGLMPANAMVRYDGNVFWPVPTKLQSSCKVDVTYFPFDEQRCRMKFGSWTYDGFQVDVTNRTQEVDLTNYVKNGEWELLNIEIVRNVVFYACCEEPFPDVTFYISIRRRTLYYMYNVIFPCILMSALTLLVFCLPPDSGEKIALGITVLLAFSVFMLAVAENLPETSEFVPLISIYLTTVMTLTSLSVIMTVFVLNLHHRGPNKRRVPHWLKVILVNKLSSFLCLHDNRELKGKFYKNEDRFMKNVSLKITLDNIQHTLENESQLENNINDLMETAVTITDSNVNSVPKTHSVRKPMCHTTKPLNSQKSAQLPQSLYENCSRRKQRPSSVINKTNEEILQSLRRILEKHEREDEDYEMIEEWRRVAEVVDRILFIIFLLATTWSSIGILVIAPATRTL